MEISTMRRSSLETCPAISKPAMWFNFRPNSGRVTAASPWPTGFATIPWSVNSWLHGSTCRAKWRVSASLSRWAISNEATNILGYHACQKAFSCRQLFSSFFCLDQPLMSACRQNLRFRWSAELGGYDMKLQWAGVSHNKMQTDSPRSRYRSQHL